MNYLEHVKKTIRSFIKLGKRSHPPNTIVTKLVKHLNNYIIRQLYQKIRILLNKKRRRHNKV